MNNKSGDGIDESSGNHCSVSFGSGARTLAPEGSTLLGAARDAGLGLEAPCGGKGICGKCRVRACGNISPPRSEELEHLGDLVSKGVRLACQARVFGPATVDFLENGTGTIRIVEGGEKLRPDLKPFTRRVILLGGALMEAGGDISLWGRLKAEGLEAAFPETTREILCGLARESLAAIPSYVEAIVRENRLLALRYTPGKRCLGIALDIGTTTVVAELVDLETGETLGVRSCLNPQTVFGGDVLTRISYGINNADGSGILQAELVRGINELIGALCRTGGVGDEEIFEMAVAGNTTMLHLLLGVDARSLARSPYHPVFTHQLHVSPGSIGIRMASSGVVTTLPAASAFVGADILAGLLACGFQNYSEPSLFIDIGTNGEIVALKNGLLLGASSAAGPALEGMNISRGCRAEDGAVQGVTISQGGTLHLDVIGNTSPRGLCGSGLIDLIAELLRAGAIEPNGQLAAKGRLQNPLDERFVEIAGRRAFVIARKEDLFLTQKDIRQVQLAKGAIATGIALLLNDLGLEYTDLERVLVAGAFGAHLRPSSLAAIGLFPRDLAGKVTFVGNTAKEGARMVLVNSDCNLEIHSIGGKLTIKELSNLPDFQDCFVKNLGFPVQAPIGK